MSFIVGLITGVIISFVIFYVIGLANALGDE